MASLEPSRRLLCLGFSSDAIRVGREIILFDFDMSYQTVEEGYGAGPGEPGLVSVVIPTYNRAYIIGNAIDSVLAQQYSNVEIIVVDDGSTDNTEAIVKSYGSPVRYIRQENAGVTAARNTGLREVRGEFIALLDSDDTWLDWKLGAQIAVLRRFPEAGMTWTDMAAIDEHGTVIAKRYLRTFYVAHSLIRIEEICRKVSCIGELSREAPEEVASDPVYLGDIFSEMFLGNLVHTSTAVIRRSRLRMTGGFDPLFQRAGEDYEFHLRTCSHGPVAFVDTPSVYYRVGASDQLSAPEMGVELATNNLLTVQRWLELGKGRINLPPRLIRNRLAQSLAWVGQKELIAGQRECASNHLWASLRLKPRLETSAYLLMSFLPSGMVRAVRDVRRRVRSARAA